MSNPTSGGADAPPQEEATSPKSPASQSEADGQAEADDASEAPEEASQSQLPGDPRPVNALQPPTKEGY